MRPTRITAAIYGIPPRSSNGRQIGATAPRRASPDRRMASTPIRLCLPNLDRQHDSSQKTELRGLRLLPTDRTAPRRYAGIMRDSTNRFRRSLGYPFNPGSALPATGPGAPLRAVVRPPLELHVIPAPARRAEEGNASSEPLLPCGLCFALPYRCDIPAAFAQFPLLPFVALPIRASLFAPVSDIRSGAPLAVPAIVRMPEAPVNEDRLATLREHKIGRPGKTLRVDEEPIPEGVQPATNDEFGLRVLATDARHQRATRTRAKTIDHWHPYLLPVPYADEHCRDALHWENPTLPH